MKRLPLLFTVLAVVALSASLAYWGLQLFQPAQRPIAAVPLQQAAEPNLNAGKALFGGEVAVAVISNYQLKGVVAARGYDSAAIVAIDGKPAIAAGVGREVAPGVTVKEVHDKYVLLSEGGVVKRLELASDAGGGGGAPPLPPIQQPIQPIQPIQPVQPIQQPAPLQGPVPPPNQQPNQPPRSSVAPVTVAPIPGFDRQ